MSTEELLETRIKIIAGWPGMEDDEYQVGQIHCGNYSDLNKEMIEKYPHLFKPLQWWQERSMVDIPMFIRFGEYDNPPYAIYKIISWNTFDRDVVERYCPCGYAERPHEYFISLRFPNNYPSTEFEYNEYLKQSKK